LVIPDGIGYRNRFLFGDNSMKRKITRYSNMTEACHDTATSAGATKRLAERLGKTPSTLCSQLNPNVDNSFFAADNVLPLMEVTNNDTPLHWLAEQRGYLCVSMIPRGSDCALEFELMKSTKEFSDVVVTYNKMMEDGKVDQQEAIDFRRECQECAAQLLAMADAVDAAVEVDPLPDSLPAIPTSGTDRKQ
jgi:hypothetical protein